MFCIIIDVGDEIRVKSRKLSVGTNDWSVSGSLKGTPSGFVSASPIWIVQYCCLPSARYIKAENVHLFTFVNLLNTIRCFSHLNQTDHTKYLKTAYYNVALRSAFIGYAVFSLCTAFILSLS